MPRKHKKIIISPFHLESRWSEDEFTLIFKGTRTNSRQRSEDQNVYSIELTFSVFWYSYLLKALKKCALAQYEKALNNIQLFK